MFWWKKSKWGNTFLITYISPEFSEEGEKTMEECFSEEMKKSDRVEMSVAFCASDSLQEVELLVEKENIQNICLILGMYFFIGLSPDFHKLVVSINKKWKQSSMGEMSLTDSFTHHGKLYCFYKNDRIFSAMMGSPNLSFLTTKKKKKSKLKQYEMGELIHKPSSLKKYQKHMEKLKSDSFSKNVVFLERYVSTRTSEMIVNGKSKKKTKMIYTKNY